MGKRNYTKVFVGLVGWWEDLPFVLKSIYFSILGRDYFCYMKDARYPSYFVRVSPEYLESLKYYELNTLEIFDTLADYGESFFADPSGDFNSLLDRYKISKHFQSLDRTDPLFIKALEMYNHREKQRYTPRIINVPRNVDWEIYVYCENDDTPEEFVEKKHIRYC